MPSKRNRGHRRRARHTRHSNIDRSSLGDRTENKNQAHDETICELSSDDKETNIVERIESLLKLDASKIVEQILEALVKICDCTEKRDFRYALLNNFGRHLQECDTKDVIYVARKTRCLFRSDNFKKLLVGDDDVFVQGYINIGKGSFGIVKLGLLKQPKGDYKQVAIKMLHSNVETALVNEAEIMVQLDHLNIVKILAFQTGNNPKLIMEYFFYGNLIEYVPMQLLSTRQLLQFILEIAEGMEYITDQKYIHCDLACRNVFVSEELHCKIGDFGLSQYVGDSDGIYEIEDGSRFGYVMAPELRTGRVNDKISWKTDVWSMGVLIWELFCLTNALSDTLRVPILRQFISRTDVKLPKVRRCPKPLYNYFTTNIMNVDPNKRPTFTMIKDRISKML